MINEDVAIKPLDVIEKCKLIIFNQINVHQSVFSNKYNVPFPRGRVTKPAYLPLDRVIDIHLKFTQKRNGLQFIRAGLSLVMRVNCSDFEWRVWFR